MITHHKLMDIIAPRYQRDLFGGHMKLGNASRFSCERRHMDWILAPTTGRAEMCTNHLPTLT
jgi:hypothetical protein